MAKQEYIEANRKWLEEKAKKEGVKALPRGIYYKVLKQGGSYQCTAWEAQHRDRPLYWLDY